MLSACLLPSTVGQLNLVITLEVMLMAVIKTPWQLHRASQLRTTMLRARLVNSVELVSPTNLDRSLQGEFLAQTAQESS